MCEGEEWWTGEGEGGWVGTSTTGPSGPSRLSESNTCLLSRYMFSQCSRREECYGTSHAKCPPCDDRTCTRGLKHGKLHLIICTFAL